MKPKILNFMSACIVTAFLCVPTVSGAAEKNTYYFSASIGKGVSEKLDGSDYLGKKMRSGAILGIAAGRRLNKHWDLDLGLFFVNNQKFRGIDDDLAFHAQSISSKALLLSGRYTFLPQYSISPYIGLGVGVGINKAGDYVIQDQNITIIHPGATTSNFGYTAAGGLKYSQHPFELFLEYRYLNLGNIKTKALLIANPGNIQQVTDPVKTKLQYHSINFGVKFLFNFL